MFRIIKAGAGIGLTENLNYIKKAENGCYILCPEHDLKEIINQGYIWAELRESFPAEDLVDPDLQAFFG